MNSYKSFIQKKSKKYILEYLISEGILTYGDDFQSKLKNISKNTVASSLISIMGDEFDDRDLKQNFISTTDKEDKVSFIPQSKINFYKDKGIDESPFKLPGRTEINIGRLSRALNSLSGKSFTNAQIEEFVNLYKSSTEKEGEKFELVNGDDIKYWYNRDNYYSRTGNLGSSCMSNVDPSFFDIYSESSKCELLTLTQPDSNGERKLLGRALVWTLNKSPWDYPKLTKFMDRIYTSKDSDVNKFKKYANENEIFYKNYNDSDADTGMVFKFNDMILKAKIEIDVEGECENYPYLDTLKFLNDPKDKLSNIGYINGYLLEDTFGSCDQCSWCEGVGKKECDECYDDHQIKCDECDGNGDQDCPECDGSGKEKSKCKECDGESQILCDECEGTGEKYTKKGNIKSCKKCEGSGYNPCEECENGIVEIGCKRCDGSGSIECERCDEDGMIDCPECLGGKKSPLCDECTGLIKKLEEDD